MIRLVMRIRMQLSNQRYLHPISPSGDYKSQFGQDYYLEKLKLVKRGGFFIEVGSNHPIDNSNSYYLEKSLGWKGISIDGVDFSEEFALHRKNTKFVNCLIDTEYGSAEFFEVHNVCGWETQLSSVYESNLSLGKGFTATKKTVQTKRFSDFQSDNQVIDLCLIDVEGHEFHVLDSIDWDMNPPKLFVIENVGEFYPRDSLVMYMKNRGYSLVARVGTTDDIFLADC